MPSNRVRLPNGKPVGRARRARRHTERGQARSLRSETPTRARKTKMKLNKSFALAAALFAGAVALAPHRAWAAEQPSTLTWTDENNVVWSYYVVKISEDVSEAWVGCSGHPGNPYFYHRAVPMDTVGDVVIPSNIGGYPVVGISDYAFEGCNGLTSVVIPDTVRHIGNFAFWGCQIQSVEIGANVTTIGEGCFRECRQLLSIDLPDSVISIEWGAFQYCTALRSIRFGNGIPNVSWDTTASYTKGTGNPPGNSISHRDRGITIGIYSNPFAGVSNLEDIEFGASVNNVKWEVFGASTHVRCVRFSGTLPTYTGSVMPNLASRASSMSRTRPIPTDCRPKDGLARCSNTQKFQCRPKELHTIFTRTRRMFGAIKHGLLQSW